VGPEQGWDRDTMLQYLSRKAGFPASQLDEARIEVYEAQVVREDGSGSPGSG
jgi:AMMECR1 domain-containing protein